MTTQTPGAPGAPTAEDRSARVAVTVFPLLILAGAAVAFLLPGTFTPLGAAINPLLGIIMFGMGLTLTLPDFRLVVTRPLPVLLGVIAQYSVMPLLGLGVSWVLQLPAELAAGIILVGCAPGGTASNVVTYLAKGDTALSVTMTSVSTLLAPLLTPVLTLWLAGQYMPVDGVGMAVSILQIVLVPVALGLVVRMLLPGLVGRALPVLPWISVVAITLVVVAVVSGSADRIVEAGLLVLAAVVLHNVLGYAVGYGFAAVTRQPERVRRTVAVEVGMQNSGLAAGLATMYLSPLAALPGAVFSVWHNVSGSILAALLRRRPLAPEPDRVEAVAS
ncbi:bile acid:sodium symporter family protein [Georgenia sp. EYE_87]|uniref:bile acid:sodium symporter family protein n=1 Tax=Georgenia sp. EYE_87 TaxID=2853448 RepID=UPI002003D25C|nr:bile acid:sodium symporter family protein [Georgenia sp. EYE_87]MCK6212746.1 bile acid:sodium symporter family protein [Georgenia sp. EYE_87]